MSKLIAMGLLFLSLPCLATMKTVTFITYEVPPYMSPSLPDGGAVTYALKQTFKKAGYDCKIIFAPLRRAKVEALKMPEVTGYFPVSPYDLAKGFAASKGLFHGAVAIVERKEKPIHWKELKDLGRYKGGFALQYTNSPEIEKLIANKTLKVDMAPDDTLNLLMLAKKRLDYVFADSVMLNYVLQTDPRFADYRNDLQINPRHIEDLDYFVAFRENSASLQVMRDFEKVARKEDMTKLVEDYLAKLDKK